VCEEIRGEFRRWRTKWFARSVKAKDDVKMGESTTLELGDLEVVESGVLREILKADTEVNGQATSDLLVRPVPET
jgi:hypothetical protein